MQDLQASANLTNFNLDHILQVEFFGNSEKVELLVRRFSAFNCFILVFALCRCWRSPFETLGLLGIDLLHFIAVFNLFCGIIGLAFIRLKILL